MSYLILTSKPGQFHTEIGPGLNPVEAYEYRFAGTLKARFVITENLGAARIHVVDDREPPVLNKVPVKFFPSFATLEAARAELRHLTKFGAMPAALHPVAA